ncbi:MAG: transposase [bacterium]
MSYYERNLPHYQPAGHTFFITFRLADSLPISAVLKLKNEKEKFIQKISSMADSTKKKEAYYSYHGKYFAKFDSLLDKVSTGPTWLLNSLVLAKLKHSLIEHDGEWYDLISYCVMPNHVHIIFTLMEENKSDFDDKVKIDCGPTANYRVTKILQNIKSKSALTANKISNRHGQFWHHESYDHVVRNEDELSRIIKYTLMNPVKAGYVENWENWAGNFLKSSYEMK